MKEKLRQELQSMSQPNPLTELQPLLRSDGGASEYVMTDTRRRYAESVLACVRCNRPVLLEGPAAAGKTTLITALARSQHDARVERVNNTDTTSIQDYLGVRLRLRRAIASPVGGQGKIGLLFHAPPPPPPPRVVLERRTPQEEWGGGNPPPPLLPFQRLRLTAKPMRCWNPTDHSPRTTASRLLSLLRPQGVP